MPPPPSVTTTSGGAMRDMSAAHAAELSLRARCHPMTFPSPDSAISTTHLRLIQMPSTWTTWWISSHAGLTGHIFQNREVAALNVRAGSPISPWVLFDKSQPRNNDSCSASASRL